MDLSVRSFVNKAPTSSIRYLGYTGGSTKRARSRIKRGKVLSNALYFALEKGLKGEIQERRGRNRKCKAFKRITRGGRFRPLPPYLLLREWGLYEKYQAMQ